MAHADKLAKILEVLNAGRTVIIATSLRVIKADAKSLYISAGKGYDCVDFCRITVL